MDKPNDAGIGRIDVWTLVEVDEPLLGSASLTCHRSIHPGRMPSMELCLRNCGKAGRGRSILEGI